MCVEGAAKIVLVIINVVFGLLGFAIFVTGALLRFGTPILMPLFQSYVQSLPVVSQSLGQGTFSNSNSSIDLSQYTGPAGIVLMCIGFGLFGISFFGCCGAYCKNRICLAVYAIILAVFATAKLAVVVYYFVAWGTVEEFLKTQMKQSITNDYAGITGTDAASIGWNVANLALTCCGVDNYTDFDSASKWKRNVTLDQTIGGVQVVQNVTLITPSSCCKTQGSLPNLTPMEFNCSYAPSSVNSNQNTGCWSSINDVYITPYKNYIGITWLIIVAIEVALMILAFVICCGTPDVMPV